MNYNEAIATESRVAGLALWSFISAILAILLSQGLWIITKEGPRCGATLGLDEPGIVCDSHFNLAANVVLFTLGAVLIVLPLAVIAQALMRRRGRRAATLFGSAVLVIMASIVSLDMWNQFHHHRDTRNILLDEIGFAIPLFVAFFPVWRATFSSRISKSSAILVITMLMFLPSTASAQSNIRGMVRDSAGAPVGLAIVRVVETNKASLSDASGRSTITNVPIGSYHMNATKLGYFADSAVVAVGATQDAVRDFVLPTNHMYDPPPWFGCTKFQRKGWTCAEPKIVELRQSLLVDTTGTGVLKDDRAFRQFWKRNVSALHGDQKPEPPNIDFRKYFAVIVSLKFKPWTDVDQHHVNRVEYGPTEAVIVIGEDVADRSGTIVHPGYALEGWSEFEIALIPRTKLPFRVRGANPKNEVPPWRDWTKISK